MRCQEIIGRPAMLVFLLIFMAACFMPTGSAGFYRCRGAISAQRVNLAVGGNGAPTLFDRKKEMAYLERFVKKRGQLLLLTGPPDCGKSAVLRKLSMQDARVSRLNLRDGDFTTAVNFTKKMEQVLSEKKLLDFESLDLNPTVSVMGTSIGFSGKKGDHIEFQDVFRTYLRKRRDNQMKPVPTIIIDEANVLQDWLVDEQNIKALESFLRFFIMITQEEDLANVVLATSEYFFKFWLDQRIGSSRYTHHVIGDFTKAEARGFFESELGRPCSFDLWEEVYSICGGRALLLKRAAIHLADDADEEWPIFKQQLLDQALSEVYVGMETENLAPKAILPEWTVDAYTAAMAEMCKHEGGVMPWKTFVACCGGAKVAKALVCYNLVLCRNRSLLTRDLEWYKGAWPVATPISQPHLIGLRELVGYKAAPC